MISVSPLTVRTSGLPVFLRSSRSSDVWRLKSLMERMSLAMYRIWRPHQICMERDDPPGDDFGQEPQSANHPSSATFSAPGIQTP
jgi:hypothetical protein